MEVPLVSISSIRFPLMLAKFTVPDPQVLSSLQGWPVSSSAPSQSFPPFLGGSQVLDLCICVFVHLYIFESLYFWIKSLYGLTLNRHQLRSKCCNTMNSILSRFHLQGSFGCCKLLRPKLSHRMAKPPNHRLQAECKSYSSSLCPQHRF